MPFTPYHFGPGLAIKAALPSQFSLTIYCYAQVITDLESGYDLLNGDFPVHRFFHTYLGAAAVAGFCAATGRPLFQWTLRQLQSGLALESAEGRNWAMISWPCALLSALVGTLSHVFLDSLMHSDMTPFAPWSSANPMLHLISVPALESLCLALGIVGGVICLTLKRF
jgi:hypothetical protein